MISLIAGVVPLVPTNIQGPLLHRVLKEIRRQHKELANVQRKENSEAWVPARDADRGSTRLNWRTRTFSRTPPPSRVVEEISLTLPEMTDTINTIREALPKGTKTNAEPISTPVVAVDKVFWIGDSGSGKTGAQPLSLRRGTSFASSISITA